MSTDLVLKTMSFPAMKQKQKPMTMMTSARLKVPYVAMKSEKTREEGKKFRPIKEIPFQVRKTLPYEKLQVLKSMEKWAEEKLLTYLKPIESSWQPQDLLPQPESDGFYDQVRQLRNRTKDIPDDYFVVLVGDMITEEALPTYQTTLNTLEGIRDETGGSLTPWAVWIRAWTAEENRHGDLLNKYLYLSGRVHMRHVEKTIHHLISCGMDSKFENNPYNGFIYTSFQERATFISHGNTAKLARSYGDDALARICGMIAADEKRHEAAYTAIVDRLFEIDPDGAITAFATMMRKRITMPAHLMHDGRDDDLFDHYAAVAQRIGVYTVADYAGILEYLLKRWKVERLGQGLSGEGRHAQEYLCTLPQRIRKIEERASERVKLVGSKPSASFSWVFDREVSLL